MKNERVSGRAEMSARFFSMKDERRTLSGQLASPVFSADCGIDLAIF
jgi:hypothetical protein